MPRYQVQCVRRETGEPSIRVYDAADERTAARYANDDGYVAGPVELLLPPPPPRPVSTFRPTFKSHLVPGIAKGSATAALVIAVVVPILTLAGGGFIAARDQDLSLLWSACAASASSFIVLGLVALYVRFLAEIASILFDIYRLLREISANLKR